MELIYHSEICQKAIGTHFSEKTLEIIIAANHKQDGLFTGLVGHPEYHFDDNNINFLEKNLCLLYLKNIL